MEGWESPVNVEYAVNNLTEKDRALALSAPQLQAENEQLRQENDILRKQIEERQAAAKAAPKAEPKPKAAASPKKK